MKLEFMMSLTAIDSVNESENWPLPPDLEQFTESKSKIGVKHSDEAEVSRSNNLALNPISEDWPLVPEELKQFPSSEFQCTYIEEKLDYVNTKNHLALDDPNFEDWPLSPEVIEQLLVSEEKLEKKESHISIKLGSNYPSLEDWPLPPELEPFSETEFQCLHGSKELYNAEFNNFTNLANNVPESEFWPSPPNDLEQYSELKFSRQELDDSEVSSIMNSAAMDFEFNEASLPQVEQGKDLGYCKDEIRLQQMQINEQKLSQFQFSQQENISMQHGEEESEEENDLCITHTVEDNMNTIHDNSFANLKFEDGVNHFQELNSWEKSSVSHQYSSPEKEEKLKNVVQDEFNQSRSVETRDDTASSDLLSLNDGLEIVEIDAELIPKNMDIVHGTSYNNQNLQKCELANIVTEIVNIAKKSVEELPLINSSSIRKTKSETSNFDESLTEDDIHSTRLTASPEQLNLLIGNSKTSTNGTESSELFDAVASSAFTDLTKVIRADGDCKENFWVHSHTGLEVHESWSDRNLRETSSFRSLPFPAVSEKTMSWIVDGNDASGKIVEYMQDLEPLNEGDVNCRTNSTIECFPNPAKITKEHHEELDSRSIEGNTVEACKILKIIQNNQDCSSLGSIGYNENDFSQSDTNFNNLLYRAHASETEFNLSPLPNVGNFTEEINNEWYELDNDIPWNEKIVEQHEYMQRPEQATSPMDCLLTKIRVDEYEITESTPEKSSSPNVTNDSVSSIFGRLQLNGNRESPELIAEHEALMLSSEQGNLENYSIPAKIKVDMYEITETAWNRSSTSEVKNNFNPCETNQPKKHTSSLARVDKYEITKAISQNSSSENLSPSNQLKSGDNLENTELFMTKQMISSYVTVPSSEQGNFQKNSTPTKIRVDKYEITRSASEKSSVHEMNNLVMSSTNQLTMNPEADNQKVIRGDKESSEMVIRQKISVCNTVPMLEQIALQNNSALTKIRVNEYEITDISPEKSSTPNLNDPALSSLNNLMVNRDLEIQELMEKQRLNISNAVLTVDQDVLPLETKRPYLDICASDLCGIQAEATKLGNSNNGIPSDMLPWMYSGKTWYVDLNPPEEQNMHVDENSLEWKKSTSREETCFKYSERVGDFEETDDIYRDKSTGLNPLSGLNRNASDETLNANPHPTGSWPLLSKDNGGTPESDKKYLIFDNSESFTDPDDDCTELLGAAEYMRRHKKLTIKAASTSLAQDIKNNLESNKTEIGQRNERESSFLPLNISTPVFEQSSPVKLDPQLNASSVTECSFKEPSTTDSEMLSVVKTLSFPDALTKKLVDDSWFASDQCEKVGCLSKPQFQYSQQSSIEQHSNENESYMTNNTTNDSAEKDASLNISSLDSSHDGIELHNPYHLLDSESSSPEAVFELSDQEMLLEQNRLISPEEQEFILESTQSFDDLLQSNSKEAMESDSFQQIEGQKTDHKITIDAFESDHSFVTKFRDNMTGHSAATGDEQTGFKTHETQEIRKLATREEQQSNELGT